MLVAPILSPATMARTIFFRSSAVGSRFIGAHGLRLLLEVHVEALGHLFFDVLDVGDVSAGSWFLIPYCPQNRNWNASSRRIQN